MSHKLVLANEGVFPVVYDISGKKTGNVPATGLNISGTVQGEGKLAGVPSLFIRFASCNLRCIWQLPDGTYSQCDTPYASFHPNDVKQYTVEEVTTLVKHNIGNLKHVVITGGEPLLQKDALKQLAKHLKTKLDAHITIETNGTLFDYDAIENIDLFSISPKLANSVPNDDKIAALGLKSSGPLSFHGERRINYRVLQKYIDLCNLGNKEIQLKFVVGKPTDEQEINQTILKQLKNWKSEDIMIMPLGATNNELQQTTALALEMAIRNGWRFTPRIHINVFGNKAGV